MLIVGIYPVFHGGVTIFSDGELIYCGHLPCKQTYKNGAFVETYNRKDTAEHDYDLLRPLFDMIVSAGEYKIFVDSLNTNFMRGITQAFSEGRAAGALKGYLHGIGVPFIQAPFNYWKRALKRKHTHKDPHMDLNKYLLAHYPTKIPIEHLEMIRANSQSFKFNPSLKENSPSIFILRSYAVASYGLNYYGKVGKHERRKHDNPGH